MKSDDTVRRIGLGGLAIESCTFSPLPSTLADFKILRGDAIAERHPHLPGWRWRNRDDLLWLPALQAKAIPGGSVRRADYEMLKRELLDRVRATLPLDGFLFDIHGAMHVEGRNDAEADLAADLRALVGPDCRIVACMDLHGNVSARLVELVDGFTAYRTAPHEDVLETRERACALLVRLLDEGLKPCRAWTRIPTLLSGERTGTFVEPGRSVYAAVPDSLRDPAILDASLWVGYAWADEPRTGSSVVVTATDPAAACREVERIASLYWNARDRFVFVAETGTADACIELALALREAPVFISDSGDNPTAGGAGDIAFFLSRLLASEPLRDGRANAIHASLPDAEAVRACFAAGHGGRVDLHVGGKFDARFGGPCGLSGEVFSLFPGDEIGGDVAVVKSGGVHVILTSRRKPFHTIREFTKLGLDPAAFRIVSVKIGYLEPELRDAARHALLALTPGAVDQDLPRLPFHRILRPVYPLDPGTSWLPAEVRIFS